MKRLLVGLLFSLWVTCAAANVPCSLPFNLLNGTTADATQVMANYNALVTCLGNAAIAVVGSALLKKVAPNFALGFLLGGGTVVIGRIVDDTLNKPIITVQAASSPLSAFYKRGYYSLPAPWGAGSVPYSPPALPAKGVHGLGWSPMRSRLAA